MNDEMTFEEAMAYARDACARGLEQFPFDAIYRTALQRIAHVEAIIARGGSLSELPEDPDIGLMAAKELGNDEARLAHALHVIQYAIDQSRGTALTP